MLDTIVLTLDQLRFEVVDPDRFAELNPQLITFNGNSFDLPVLRYRAMINEVAAPGLSMRP